MTGHADLADVSDVASFIVAADLAALTRVDS